MSIRYVNMSGTMKPIMEFGSFRNVQILELPKSRMLVFCLHCGGEIRKFKDMVSCIFVTLKAMFGIAVATLKRDKRKKSRRTPRVRRAFTQRLQCKTQIFELRGGKSEKRAPSCVRV